LGLVGLAPVAFLAPKTLSFPLDMALAFALPLHGHIGMNYVITDYVPKFISKAATGPARIVQAGITFLTAAGLLKLNLTGPGITGTILKLWSSSSK